MARARRPRLAVPARHRSAGERAARSRALGTAVWRRSRDPAAAGDRARHRRRAGAARARLRARALSPQRGARGLRGAAAHSRPLRSGARPSRRRWPASAAPPCSPPTRRWPRATTPSRSAWSKRTWPGCGATSATNRARFLDLGSHDNGAGPMFNMTALAMRTAASVNGVSQLHGEVTRQMWQSLWPGHAGEPRAGEVAHQRRPRADVDVGGDRAAARPLPRARLAREPRRPGAVRPRARDSRRRAVGSARVAAHVSLPVRARAGAPALDHRGRRRGAGRGGGHDVRPERADHRLRPALHRLQAPRAALHRSAAPRRHPQQVGPAGAVRVRRQGPSRRRHRQAPPAAHLPPRPRSDVRRPHCRGGRLRHARGRTSWSRAATCG